MRAVHTRERRARATHTLSLCRKRAALRRFFVCVFSPFFSFQKKETESTPPAVLRGHARVPDRSSDRVDTLSFCAVVVRRATLARAVVSARRAHSRIRERATDRTASRIRLRLNFAAGEHLVSVAALASARRSRRSSHVGTGCPTRVTGAGHGTGLRDERHVHRVRLGRPPRRAPARACELAPRAPRRARSGSRRRARPRERSVGRDETRRRSSVSFGIRRARGAARRARSRRARPRRSRVGGGRAV